MDLRHSTVNTWRRTSPAPVCARTCTPAPASSPAQRRIESCRRVSRRCTSTGRAMAMSSLAMPTTVPTCMESSEEFSCRIVPETACSLETACPAILQTRLSKAHSSAASAALVVQDTLGEKLVATASLDKGMAIWRFYAPHKDCDNSDGLCEERIEVTRLKVPGAPVFSIAKIPEVLPDGTIVRKRPKPPGIYLGTAAKEVLTWMLGSKDVTDKVVLGDHTGWVRSLAVTGKWLFSCGCNELRLWDTTFRTPKEAQAVRLFTGDILTIAAVKGQVFTAGADGSLHAWSLSDHPQQRPASSGGAGGGGGGGAGGGCLTEGPQRERAHESRVTACVAHEGRVFTVSYDGSIKAWDAATLELVAEVRGAHRGEKVICAAVGANGVLFTGGDDKLIRAWDMNLTPVGPPLEGHTASVRVLAAGRRGLLVSGDADGDVCIWETYPVELPPAAAAAGNGAAAAAADPLQPAFAATAAAVGGAIEQQQLLHHGVSELEAAAAAAAAAEAAQAAVDGQVGSPDSSVDEYSITGATMQQLETAFAAPAQQAVWPGPQTEAAAAAAAAWVEGAAQAAAMEVLAHAGAVDAAAAEAVAQGDALAHVEAAAEAVRQAAVMELAAHREDAAASSSSSASTSPSHSHSQQQQHDGAFDVAGAEAGAAAAAEAVEAEAPWSSAAAAAAVADVAAMEAAAAAGLAAAAEGLSDACAELAQAEAVMAEAVEAAREAAAGVSGGLHGYYSGYEQETQASPAAVESGDGSSSGSHDGGSLHSGDVTATAADGQYVAVAGDGGSHDSVLGQEGQAGATDAAVAVPQEEMDVESVAAAVAAAVLSKDRGAE